MFVTVYIHGSSNTKVKTMTRQISHSFTDGCTRKYQSFTDICMTLSIMNSKKKYLAKKINTSARRSRLLSFLNVIHMHSISQTNVKMKRKHRNVQVLN